MLKSEYYNRHRYCPNCSSNSIITTTMAVVSGDKDVINTANCTECDWKGVVDDLMDRRWCQIIIRKIMNKIPKDKQDFLKDLEWNYNDSCYKAPEETLQWERTAETLQRYIPIPKENWEFEVASIFTELSIDELKEKFRNV